MSGKDFAFGFKVQKKMYFHDSMWILAEFNPAFGILKRTVI